MAKLIVSLANSFVEEIQLTKDIITIGRSADNDIRTDSQSASNHHARVELRDGRYFLEDTGSTNGTLVNGQKTQKRLLDNNDIISIGQHEICFVSEEHGAEANEGDFAKTIFIAPSKPKQAAAEKTPHPVTPPPATPPVESGRFLQIVGAVVGLLAIVLAIFLWRKIGG